MSIVIKMGGSLLFNKNGDIDTEKVNKFVEIIKKSKNISAIIIGGGIIARKYISAARTNGVNETFLDLLGIDVSRTNARFLISLMNNSVYPKVITNVEDAMVALSMGKLIISGGFIPGQSTTTVSLEIGEALNCENLLVLTDVDGIYDKNPKEYPDAKKFDSMTISQIEEVLINTGSDKQAAAGEYRIFDSVSLQILKRSKIQVRLLNGNNFNDLNTIIKQNNKGIGIGTLITK